MVPFRAQETPASIKAAGWASPAHITFAEDRKDWEWRGMSPHPKSAFCTVDWPPTTPAISATHHQVLHLQHMETVGVRELQQRASAALRRVERGETLGITDRGRLVAVLTSPSTAPGLASSSPAAGSWPPGATSRTFPPRWNRRRRPPRSSTSSVPGTDDVRVVPRLLGNERGLPVQPTEDVGGTG